MKPGADGFCFQHSPARAAERDEARRRGGLSRAKELARAVLEDAGPISMKSPEDVRGFLCELIGHTITGRLDCRVAATAGTLASAVLKCLEQGELAERLAALEVAVSQRGVA